jgi:hypothetical protein
VGQVLKRVRATLAVVALLLAGCSSSITANPVDTPPQKGAALAGWAFFAPTLGNTLFEGATSRGVCEALREKELEAAPALKLTPCFPVKVTAD